MSGYTISASIPAQGFFLRNQKFIKKNAAVIISGLVIYILWAGHSPCSDSPGRASTYTL
jgi:hypothetical protein